MTWDIATVNEEWLIDLCHKAEKENGISGGLKEGDRVIKISDDIAVKYGYGVTASEAATQDFAYNTVNSNIVHIPRVYRFIESKGTTTTTACTKGYLFMEYVQGKNPKDVDLKLRRDLLPRIAKIVAHLGQIQGGQRPPGPVGGGEPQGYLWDDNGANTTFNSIEDLNIYMNKRLKLRNDSIDLSPCSLVLCHMDLCRRNFILKDVDDDGGGGALCLVDWGLAGFYPRFFEVASISCMLPYDAPYEEPLLQEIEKVVGLTDEEKRLMRLVHYVRAVNLRYLL